MGKKKNIIPLVMLIGLWGTIAALCWLKPADDFSVSERRKLAARPELNRNDVMSGMYFKEFETYTLDQFPGRDLFRTLKSVSEYYLFGKSDNNGIYISDGYAAKIEYPLNESSVEGAVKKFNYLYETYVKNTNGEVYLSLIPDKGYLMAEETGHPEMDYHEMFEMVKKGMPYAEYIEIADALELSDYYKTDTHWKQEEITDIAEMLAEAMGTEISGEYKKTNVGKPFYGVYYGQSALPLKSDTICYLTNDALDACEVYNEETKKTMGLYDFDKLESRDMYEVFLSGASPLLYIENPNALSQKELIVFRDSFASGIVPLLAEGYSKITLVDTRYIRPEMLGEYVDFSDADVLFLYSTTVLNNSQTLR